ncbi:MAG: hypothetical protein QOE19_1271 [Actinomycetota bacterium]|jgi:MFS family permease|nr:hypothetical protein [Actinomycetota bacterium]MDQ1664974.1 hypothetical protein [Actinomycetota bacterium]MDQ1670375.1 hypothetical protein [Actinomycetota bacterium]
MSPVASRRLSRDVVAAAGGAAVYSCSLGMASVALPLLALRSGYSGTDVGALTAASAAAQMISRVGLGWVMRRVGDWSLIAGASLLLAASNAVLVLSADLAPFVAACLLQGVSRAFFWTGSQTHVVRRPGSSVSALAQVNFISSAGSLAGPVLAGVLAGQSMRLALVVATGVALLATIPATLLDRLPPFVRPLDRPAGRLWRRPGVSTGCWAGATAGAWRGLLSSYVPVALEAARQSSRAIGILVSVANAASVLGSVIVARVHGPWVGRSLVAGCLLVGLSMSLFVPVAELAWLAAAVLALSGLGAGALQTVGPAVATDAVHPEERGEAIAATGAFRAAALFGAPLAVAGAIAVAPLAAAMAVTGVILALPALRVPR